ncbi:MAG TPA: HD domain-containing phosphohydrolase [Gaiellales bacterium]
MPNSVAPSHAQAYPRLLVWYTTTVTCLAVPITLAALGTVAMASHSLAVLGGVGVFAAAAVVAEALPVPLDDTGTRSISLAFIFLLATQILFGWWYAVLAAILAMAFNETHNRVPVRRGVFNISVYAIATFSSSLPSYLIGWDGRILHSTDSNRLSVLALAGGVCFVFMNVVLTAVAVSLARRVSLWSVLDDFLRSAGPAFGIMALISALATSLWRISPPLEFLLAGPLLSLGMYQRYAYRSALAMRDAGTDGLTGLHNHRSFQADLRADIEDEEHEESEQLALAVLDIDDFKSINDRFGHPIGDEVLKRLAGILRDQLEEARVYRVGGEEFAVLLNACDAEGARRRLEELHSRLESAEFAHGEPVTVSVGIAVFPDMATDRDELQRIADSALYWAKNHGKARSCVYSPSVEQVRSQAEIAAQAERVTRLRAAENLIRFVEAKDTYTGEHSEAVSRYTEAIGLAMELDAETVEYLRLAGLLHDLGKIAIPDSILRKAGKLLDEEQRVLQEHAEIGYQLLQGADVAPIDLWIRHHHESWDGTGYPKGLRGEEIPLGSRIILVADAFDAMTSDRVYRPGGSTEAAIAELRRCSWAQFDARVVAALELYVSLDELAATG